MYNEKHQTKPGPRGASREPATFKRRTILCVDPHETYTKALQDTWVRLRFADTLHTVHSQEEALAFLAGVAADGNRQGTLAAVILDPEATGEETGAFVRAVRKHCSKHAVPIVFWSHDSDKYEVLEGRGVDSVLKKPMILRLIQSLDDACQLQVHHFQPFAGNCAFVHPNAQPQPTQPLSATQPLNPTPQPRRGEQA